MEEVDPTKFSEDWKKEYEKIILTKKYANASEWIGYASTDPVIEHVKRAYGFVVDYVTAMPLPEVDKLKDKRKEFTKKLDDIGLILFGVPSKEVEKLMKHYKVIREKTKEGGKIVNKLHNLPNIVKALRDILIEAGEFATSSGLRVTLRPKRTFGKERLMEEEGFEDLEVE